MFAIAQEVAFPKPTEHMLFEMGLGISPMPTQPPLVHQDFKRQAASGSQIGWLGPDNTCGYEKGLQGQFASC
jgi:hypothetical protein